MSENGAKLVAEVRKIARENRDHTYQPPTCVYMDESGCPSCIIGRALFNLGYLPAHPDIQIEGDGVQGVLRKLKIEVDPEEGIWLNCVQMAQDGRVPDGALTAHPRRTWGDAITFANALVYIPMQSY